MSHFPIPCPRLMLACFLSWGLLAGCTTAPKTDFNVSFGPGDESSLVIASLTKKGLAGVYHGYVVTFRQYDEKTHRLVPDRGEFSFGVVSSDLGFVSASQTTVRKVPSGTYILVSTDSCRDYIGYCRTSFALKSQSDVSLNIIKSGASVERVYAHRVKLNPGEIVFLGDFQVGPYRPHWVNRGKIARDLLAALPNVRGTHVFRSPVLSFGLHLPPPKYKIQTPDANSGQLPDLTAWKSYVIREREISEIGIISENTEFVLSDPKVIKLGLGHTTPTKRWRTCATLVNPPDKDETRPRVIAYTLWLPDTKAIAIRRGCDWFQPDAIYYSRVRAAIKKQFGR